MWDLSDVIHITVNKIHFVLLIIENYIASAHAFGLISILEFLEVYVNKKNLRKQQNSRDKIYIPNTQIHDLWPLTHKYMTSHFPVLVQELQ